MTTQPQPPADEKLMPCPFCGNAAMMFPPTCKNDSPYNAADRAFPIVRCMHCAAQVGGNNWDHKGKSAIEFWNTRRATPPAAPAEDTAKKRTDAEFQLAMRLHEIQNVRDERDRLAAELARLRGITESAAQMVGVDYGAHQDETAAVIARELAAMTKEREELKRELEITKDERNRARIEAEKKYSEQVKGLVAERDAMTMERDEAVRWKNLAIQQQNEGELYT